MLPGWLICSRCRMIHSSERAGRRNDRASHTELPLHGDHSRCPHVGAHCVCSPNTHTTCWAAKSLNTLAQALETWERTRNIHRPMVYLLADDRNHPVILQTNHHYHTYHHREFGWSHEFHESDRFLNPRRRNNFSSTFCENISAQISSSQIICWWSLFSKSRHQDLEEQNQLRESHDPGHWQPVRVRPFLALFGPSAKNYLTHFKTFVMPQLSWQWHNETIQGLAKQIFHQDGCLTWIWSVSWCFKVDQTLISVSGEL